MLSFFFDVAHAGSNHGRGDPGNWNSQLDSAAEAR
jgi:hypothetical protein